MTHLVDAERLVDLFAESDPTMPLLVFSLLSLYLRDGAFEFDATELAERLSEIPMSAHINPEQLAALQPQIERFFVATEDGWTPRPGVLRHQIGDDGARGADHSGRLPGQLA